MQNSWTLFFQFIRCKAHLYTNQFRVWVKTKKWRPPRESESIENLEGSNDHELCKLNPQKLQQADSSAGLSGGGQGRKGSSRWMNNDVVWSIALTMPQVLTQLHLIGWVEGYLGRNSIHILAKPNKLCFSRTNLENRCLRDFKQCFWDLSLF